jgi:hypothetical protein
MGYWVDVRVADAPGWVDDAQVWFPKTDSKHGKGLLLQSGFCCVHDMTHERSFHKLSFASLTTYPLA